MASTYKKPKVTGEMLVFVAKYGSLGWNDISCGSKCQDGKNSRVISLWMEPRCLPCVKIVKNSARIFPRICDRQVAQDSCSMATFRSFTNVNPNFRSSHKKKWWYTKLVLSMCFWFLKSSTFNQSLWKTNSAFSWATCAPDSFESISCIWDNTDGRTQEIHHLFSHSCFLKAPSVPRTITVTRDAHAGP